MGLFGPSRNRARVAAQSMPAVAYIAYPQFNPAGLTNGWAPGPGTPSPQQQIGAFSGPPLNQYPAYISGVQLHSGREWGNSSWYYPTAGVLPPGGQPQLTQQSAQIAGAQRYGSLFGGPIGPISAKRYRAKIAAAQARQSGAQAMAWAQGLSS